MKTSEKIANISKALLNAQKHMGNASKDSANPFFKSKYADLNAIREACLPALHEAGITALQPTVTIEGKNFVETILLHESGEYISSLTEIVYSKPNDAQAQGSGITYARRYGLQSLMNVGAEDDDGNKASNPVSNGHATAPAPSNGKSKPELTPAMPAWKKAVDHIAKGGTIEKVEESYFLSPGNRKNLQNEATTTV